MPMPIPHAHRRTVTDHLTHDGIKGEPVSIVDILVPRQPPIDRLPEQPIKPVDRVLAPAAVAERAIGDIGQPKRVIQLAHHQHATVRTELSARELKPHTEVEIHPIIPRGTRTLWVIHKTRPSPPAIP